MPAEPQIVTTVPLLPKRASAMHKGDAGRLFCVAGSVGMVGAAALCSRAALRSGAGLLLPGALNFNLGVLILLEES
jgi:NAD(P)H-hydrate repair Nnr-like enzyme with NAD(P)H-hydrate dehydratase domain